MEKLIAIMEEIVPGINYLNCIKLVDAGIYDSFAILSLVSEIEENFEIEVSPEDLNSENFNSAQNIWTLIERYKVS